MTPEGIASHSLEERTITLPNKVKKLVSRSKVLRYGVLASSLKKGPGKVAGNRNYYCPLRGPGSNAVTSKRTPRL